MDCCIAFGAMFSVSFQTKSMFPYAKEKAPSVMLRMLDLSNAAAGEKAVDAGLANRLAGHPLGSCFFSSLPLQSH